MRKLLLKTAQKQAEEGQWCSSFDTFCQLVIASDGRMTLAEAKLFSQVVQQKISHTNEFFCRVRLAVEQKFPSSRLDCNNNNKQPVSDGKNAVVDELWDSMCDEMYDDCQEMYEVIKMIRPIEIIDTNSGNSGRRKNTQSAMTASDESRLLKNNRSFSYKLNLGHLILLLKYQMALVTCAFWTETMPEESDEVNTTINKKGNRTFEF